MVGSGVPFCFIIEASRPLQPKHQTIVTGVLENMAIEHHIHIIPTFSTVHTATSIVNLSKKLFKLAQNATEGPEGHKGTKGSENQQEKKGGNQVPILHTRGQKVMDNIFTHQLQLIQGVSENVAQAISEKFSDIPGLITAFVDNGPDALADIQVKNRKLGKVVSKRIYSVYCSDQMDSVDSIEK